MRTSPEPDAPDEVRRTDIATTFDHVAFTCTDRSHMEARLKQHNIHSGQVRCPRSGYPSYSLETLRETALELSFAGDQA